MSSFILHSFDHVEVLQVVCVGVVGSDVAFFKVAVSVRSVFDD